MTAAFAQIQVRSGEVNVNVISVFENYLRLRNVTDKKFYFRIRASPVRVAKIIPFVVAFLIGGFLVEPPEQAGLMSDAGPLFEWVLCSFLLISLAAPQLNAARHPVPLDEKTNAATCSQCHADKTKGEVVHPAMAGGCLVCHEVRVSGKITWVKLTTGTSLSLCLTCHPDKNAEQIKGKVHPPAIHGCVVCHDPHTSNYKYLLVKPASGATKAENLCLSCHDTGVAVPKDGSRHPALDVGCEACHSIHKSGDPMQRVFAYHLSKDAPELCWTCHNSNDPALAKAHQNQPFGKADCLQCHDPHQSARPFLAQEFLHPPYAAMSCGMCHMPPKEGKVVLTAQDVNSLCATCHADKPKEIQTAKVPHPGAQGECTVCHNPHAGTSPAFLEPNPVAVCLTCHSDLADQGKKAYVHKPAFGQSCAICHEPHGGANPNLLRLSDVNSLCLECHGPNARPQPVNGTDQVAIFDGKVVLPKGFFRQVPILPLNGGRGHPIANHPISGPTKLNGKTVQMNCLSCHQPHASSNPGLLVNDQEPSMAFCNMCHTQGMLALPKKD
ncbi:MAG TPA: cytochrome c3 family protein [Terriglobia bacterium]|nr:cytochrome c3 family protein [Terriglobia bacterium]